MINFNSFPTKFANQIGCFAVIDEDLAIKPTGGKVIAIGGITNRLHKALMFSLGHLPLKWWTYKKLLNYLNVG